MFKLPSSRNQKVYQKSITDQTRERLWVKIYQTRSNKFSFYQYEFTFSESLKSIDFTIYLLLKDLKILLLSRKINSWNLPLATYACLNSVI